VCQPSAAAILGYPSANAADRKAGGIVVTKLCRALQTSATRASNARLISRFSATTFDNPSASAQSFRSSQIAGDNCDFPLPAENAAGLDLAAAADRHAQSGCGLPGSSP